MPKQTFSSSIQICGVQYGTAGGGLAMEPLQNIHRAFDVVSTSVDHMGIYHSRLQVLMAEELLDGADVVSVFE